MTIIDQFWDVAVSNGTNLQSQYPSGAPGTVSWSGIPAAFNFTQGTPFSVNVQTAYLSPSSGCTVTMNGAIPVGSGISFDGTTFAYNGTGLCSLTHFSWTAVLGSVSVQSPGFTAQATQIPTQTGIAFHPGHYVALDQNATLQENINHINDDLAGSPGLIGVTLYDFWSGAEFGTSIAAPNSPGIYQAGTQGDASTAGGIYAIQLLLAACKAATSSSAPNGLMLQWGVEAKAFGTWRANGGSYGAMPAYFDITADSTGSAPLYLEASQSQASEPGSLLCCPKNYDSVITNRWDQMMKAYGAAFNGDPNFEMVHNADETSNGLYNNDTQYNNQIQQMCGVNPSGGAVLALNWGASMAKYFPNKGRRFTTNFMGGSTNTALQFQTLFNNSIQYAVAMGGPDSSTNLSKTNGSVEVGNDLVIFNGAFGGGSSYVNNLPFVAETQSVRGYDTSNNTPTIATLYAFYMTTAGSLANGGQCYPNYWIWHPYDGVPYTLSQILALISGNNPLNTNLPQCYGTAPQPYNFYVSPTGSASGTGSSSSPWSMAALSQLAIQKQYAGKTVGVQDGTYNIYTLIQALASTGSQQTAAISLNGGPKGGPPTLIQAINPRKVILTGVSPSGGYPTVAGGMIGQGGGNPPPNLGNVILDGFYITKGWQYGVNFYLNSTEVTGLGPNGEGGATGIELRNCEIFDIGGVIDNNVAGVFMQNCTGAWIHNNKIHSVQPALTGQNAGANTTDVAGIFSYSCWSNTYEYNTIYDCNQAFRDKFTPNGNHTMRYNFVEVNGTTPVAAIGDGNGGSLTDTYSVYNNIFNVIGAGATLWYSNYWPGGASEASNNAFHQNTCIFPAGGNGAILPAGGAAAGTPPARANHYCNIYAYQGSPNYQGVLAVTIGGLQLSDYNLYGTLAATNGLLTIAPYANPGAPGANSVGGEYTLAQFQSLGFDAHSFALNATFNGAQSLTPSSFQLVNGTPGDSAGSNPGRIGGVTSGALTDMGAWGGIDVNTNAPPAQIGCSFPVSGT